MARIFVTGSADGLGRATADTLLTEGHEVVVHVRAKARLPAVEDLIARGATAVIGDLADLAQTRHLAEQVNAIGAMDAVVHNAGVYTGRSVLPVNVVAPYVLTALVPRPARLVYLSSGMHRGGRPKLEGMDWTGERVTGSYSDSKLFVTTLAAAVARLWPDVLCNAVDPGWVPTKMGGAHAPDDLQLGHRTQEWLAASDDAAAKTSGGYWYHQQRTAPHRDANDHGFQEQLLAELARRTIGIGPASSRVRRSNVYLARARKASRAYRTRGQVAMAQQPSGRPCPPQRSWKPAPPNASAAMC